MSVEEKVREIIVDQLGVDEKQVTADAGFIDDWMFRRVRLSRARLCWSNLMQLFLLNQTLKRWSIILVTW